MIDIELIRKTPELVKDAMKKRGADIDIDYLLDVDRRRLETLRATEELHAEQNRISDEIAKYSRGELPVPIEKFKKSKELKDRVGHKEFELKTLDEELTALLYKIPNIPFPEVPVGPDESANVVLREVGEKSKLETPKDYIALGESLDLIDTERAAKVSGARFGYLKHEAPLLEFALVHFVLMRLSDIKWIKRVVEKAGLDVAVKLFTPLVPPVMIRPDIFRAMGKLDPGQEDERYYLPKDDLYLIGSAEHTTGAMHMNETFEEEKLPHRYIAFSTSFRREAGSYGKDTRGIIRVHQFDKLEMFSFTLPGKSKDEHDLFLAIQEALMQELKLPYRVMLIATGDMVSTDAKQYDIETWLPGSGAYRETHSTSNSTDYQSRRLNVKYRNQDGKTVLVHTVNGTAFAIGRAIIAILENYQDEDGSVRIPEVLQTYMGGIEKISPTDNA